MGDFVGFVSLMIVNAATFFIFSFVKIPNPIKNARRLDVHLQLFGPYFRFFKSLGLFY
jgi:hypothetical protein